MLNRDTPEGLLISMRDSSMASVEDVRLVLATALFRDGRRRSEGRVEMAGPDAVFVDAGPLIVLARSGSLRLLQELFRVVRITAPVRVEVLPPDDLPGKCAIRAAMDDGWIREDTATPAVIAGLRDHVDDGEASTIEAAIACPAALVVLDDRNTRLQAVELNLRVSGTIGVLLLARHERLIPRVADVIRSMIEAGMYVSPGLVTAALERAGGSADLVAPCGTKTNR